MASSYKHCTRIGSSLTLKDSSAVHDWQAIAIHVCTSRYPSLCALPAHSNSYLYKDPQQPALMSTRLSKCLNETPSSHENTLCQITASAGDNKFEDVRNSAQNCEAVAVILYTP